MNKRTTAIIVTLIIVVFVAILALYFTIFRFGLSHSSTTWSEFGGYVSGVLMPILTAINIYVFIKLTNAISEKDSKQSEKEMVFQKQLMLMQFRKKEIDEFEERMDSLFSFNDIGTLKDLHSKVNNTIIYLGSFQSTKLSLFGCNKDSGLKKDIDNLIKLLSGMDKKWDNNKTINNETILEEYMPLFYTLKNSIVRSLQDITINCD
jgi:uncharacterized membrane protein